MFILQPRYCGAIGAAEVWRVAPSRPLTNEQNKNRTNKERGFWRSRMYRFAREALALASVVGFVWMVSRVAGLAG